MAKRARYLDEVSIQQADQDDSLFDPAPTGTRRTRTSSSSSVATGGRAPTQPQQPKGKQLHKNRKSIVHLDEIDSDSDSARYSVSKPTPALAAIGSSGGVKGKRSAAVASSSLAAAAKTTSSAAKRKRGSVSVSAAIQQNAEEEEQEQDSFLKAASTTQTRGKGRGRRCESCLVTLQGKVRVLILHALDLPTPPAEVADDFHFVRETASGGVSSSASTQKNGTSAANTRAGIRYTSRRVMEDLPVDAVGETPIANRNRARRAGLDGGVGLGQPSSSSTVASSSLAHRRADPAAGPSGSSGRRDSLGLKSHRRASSLRNGTIAHPHDRVPDEMLYRHCAEMDPVGRMKFLLAWCLQRSVQGLFDGAGGGEKAGAGASGKGKKGKKAVSKKEEEVLGQRKQVEALLREVMERVVEDIDAQEVSVSWLSRPGRSSEVRFASRSAGWQAGP